MKKISFFIERKEIIRVFTSHTGRAERKKEYDQGLGITQEGHDGYSYRWMALSGSGDEASLSFLPGGVQQQTGALLAHPRLHPEVLADYQALAQELLTYARINGAHALDVSLRACDQHILATGDAGPVTDNRRFATLSLRCFQQANGSIASVFRALAYQTYQELLQDRNRFTALIDDMIVAAQQKLAAVSCPEGDLPVLLIPGGSPAQFFHEICGHPLEGDLVVRQLSYLARRQGQRIAEPFLTVVDSPLSPGALFSYNVDDEGTPAQPVELISQGIVAEPLLDRRHARLLGHPPNGHGRRLNFRYYAIPRLCHTLVKPHQGTLQELAADIRHGLVILDMNLRHMHMASGEFSFYIHEAREIRDGVIGAFVRPGLMRGNALEALRNIDAVGADNQSHGAGGGCGKLDQGPLYISFEQPTLRFKRLSVEPSL